MSSGQAHPQWRAGAPADAGHDHRPRHGAGGQPQHGDQPGVRLGTSRGRQALALTVGLDLLASVAAAVFLVELARLIAQTPSSGGLIVAALAGLVHVASGAGCRSLCRVSSLSEEQPLRERLLERWWRTASGIHARPAVASQEPAGIRSGDRISLFTDSVERFTQYRQGFAGRQRAAGIAPLCVLGVIAVSVDPVIAVILALAVPCAPLAIKRFSALSRTAANRSRELRSRLATQYLESIQGLETLAIANAAPRVARELAEAGERSRRATMAVLARNQLVLLVSDAAFSLVMVTLSAALAAWRLGSGAITPAGAIAVVLCSVLLLSPLDLVASSFYVGLAGQGAQRALQRFWAPRGESPQAQLRPAPNPGPEERIAHHLAERKSDEEHAAPSVRLSGAHLGYPGAPVLHDVDFTVPRRGRVVVLGPSGAGKSTLLRALKGDLLPEAGEVVIDGIALSAGTQERVRGHSALVAQSTWLFTGSIRDNLALVNPQADEDALWQALQLVDLAGFVTRMPDGLDSAVGERGQALSGGQVQRLSLARAFLSGRELLLLDEPTSQVDLFSEQVIMAALDQLAADHTIVLVTHRPSAVAGASAIWEVANHGLQQIPAGQLHRGLEASDV